MLLQHPQEEDPLSLRKGDHSSFSAFVFRQLPSLPSARILLRKRPFCILVENICKIILHAILGTVSNISENLLYVRTRWSARIITFNPHN
jgi:hypothetical protein